MTKKVKPRKSPIVDFDMKNWRSKMTEKLGCTVTQKKAGDLLGYKNHDIICKIEKRRNSAKPQMVRLADLLLITENDKILPLLNEKLI